MYSVTGEPPSSSTSNNFNEIYAASTLVTSGYFGVPGIVAARM